MSDVRVPESHLVSVGLHCGGIVSLIELGDTGEEIEDAGECVCVLYHCVCPCPDIDTQQEERDNRYDGFSKT